MAHDRRDFLRGLGGAVVAARAWPALAAVSPARAADAQVTPDIVRLRPEIEPVVRWIEDTPRERVLDTAIDELKKGLSYRHLLGGIFLAGIRNIKPRPVGFKFHAVMAINSAHQLGLDAPQQDRLLALFWALDNFKSSQAQDVKEGDWWLEPVKEAAVPGPAEARKRFTAAMDRWDDEAADAAVTGLCRAAGAGEVMEYLWRYGARDQQNIGHKIIFTAQAFRTLQTIGWEHAEPVLRSLVFGLLNGGPGEAAAPYAANQARVARIRADWAAGQPDAGAAASLLDTLRHASADEAAEQALELLNRGVAASSLWDAVLLAAGELLMRQPGIVPLHATTASNSLYYAFRASGDDAMRLLLLLQAASWITMFREGTRARSGLPDSPRIDQLEPAADSAAVPVGDLLAEMGKNRASAARRVLARARAGGDARDFVDGARHLIFTKGTDSHDYKFAAAAFEDALVANATARPELLAASVYYLRSAGDPDSPLTERARQALARL